ncbi:shikimate kinase [Pilimelia terevasa]|uniref:Shikimate kinase n=1 Tax=Pilimelia terevasa TaxID=53372 RepID=A0A8J3FHA6_9ACTN|nr:shikimate kinase [Pilimelia terevasa]GGK25355.1 shikimate kinase [Pilimelia terevasa]
MSGPVCVLVGPPGAGKSTVGAALAAALGLPYRDTDADVEAAEGRPIPEVFVDDGEAYFRERERAAVAAALAGHAGVLSLGGGAVLDARTRAALAGHPVVYLSVDLPDAMSRIGLGSGRPLLAVNPRATLRHLLELRRPLYAEVAAHTVRTDGRTPEQIVAEVRAHLGR